MTVISSKNKNWSNNLHYLISHITIYCNMDRETIVIISVTSHKNYKTMAGIYNFKKNV